MYVAHVINQQAMWDIAIV